jgi:hypothetical protein
MEQRKYMFTFGFLDGSEQWEEEYEVDASNPEEQGKHIIKTFNATLKPGEKPRKYIACRVVGESTEHDWEKLTDGMSVSFRGSCVDMYRCNKCGITGKRYGLGSQIVRDSKYKANKYKLCNPSSTSTHHE